MKKSIGTLMLLIAALVWGLAFAAQSQAADTVDTFTFNATRCTLGTLFIAAIIFIRDNRDRRAGKIRRSDAHRNRTIRKKSIKAGTICGVILFIATSLQQFGIAAYPPEAAASSRSGFITATYVIMIAVFTLFTSRKPHPAVLAAAAGCVGGMYLLCLSEGIDSVYLGDLLVLLCAVAFTVHVLTIDRYASYDGLVISCVQFAVVTVLSYIAMFIFEKPDMSAILSAWLPIVYAGIFSGGIGYTLQIIGQKYAEPTVASIVMSLESVFAALAGWALLNERLSGVEILGCALVFASVILAQVPGFIKTKAVENS